MNIRTRLTLLFVSIVALILIGTSIAIYFFSSDYREDEFYQRLENKGRITAKLLIEVDEVNEDVLRKIEEDNFISLSNENILIYGQNDEVLYRSDERQMVTVDKELRNRVMTESYVKFRQGNYEGLGFLFVDREGKFVVIVAAIDFYGLNKLRNLRTILMIVLLVGIIVILISGYLYAGNALKPISNVIREVDDISATSLHRRVDPGGGKDEIAQLAHTFNSMLDRIQQAFTTQKQFIANASHEIRNPLTAIMGQIDVCLINARSPEEYQAVLRSLREDITQLKAVSNRLLLLAQASVEDVDRRLTPQRADQLLWEAKSELTKLHPEYAIHIEMDPSIDDESKLNILADEQLLKAALINIMDNGCKFSGNHAILVRLFNRDHAVVIELEDHGIGIRAEDKHHIFEPFFRGANAQGVKGHGIGLSLVYRIVKGHEGQIDIRSSENSGTLVVLEFPIASR